MRDNSNIELCRALCQSFAAGPGTPNSTKSLPLHFASKRWKPNKELLKLLIRRNPGAASVFNEFGLLPLHCACATTDDLEAVKMIYDAYPEAITMKDRQGKTCLHLAVLAVGHDHEQAIIREEEQEQLQRELEAKALKLQLAKKGDAKAPIGGGVKKKISAAALAAQTAALSLAGGGGDDDNDSDYDEEELDRKEKEQNMTNEMNERDGSRSRKVIQFLISKWPEALVTDNNFLATPVETVLEKSRRIKSLSRRISIFGLFDDPPTARLLLNAQKYRAEKRLLPPLRPRFFSTLRELNWLARRDAVLLSSIGEKRTIGNTDNSGKIRLTVGGNSTSTAKTKQKNKSESKTQFQKEKDKMKDKDKNTNTNKESLEGDDKNDNGECHTIIVTVCGDEDIPKNNILARFRRRGHMDIVRQVVAWI